MTGIKHKLLSWLFRQHRISLTKTHQLDYLFWECTLRCNLNCLHCGSDCHKNALVNDMPANDFLNVIRQLPKNYNRNNILIVITGGEPLLRNDLTYIGTELYKMGHPWGIVTNGMALNSKKLDELLLSGLRTLTISLDGLFEQHNYLRQNKNAYNNAINAIALAAKKTSIEFDVVTCVHHKNIDELPQLAEVLINLGVKKWRLFSIFPKGRAVTHNLALVNNKKVEQLLEFIKQTRLQGKIKASFGCEGFLGNYEMQVRDTPFFCRAGITVASVLADGTISACPSIDRCFAQGNIYTDNFNFIWENKFEIMRNRDWAKTGICKTCNQWKNCLGNGLHLRQHNMKGPAYCHYNILNNKV